jgi:hypothetical protein
MSSVITDGTATPAQADSNEAMMRISDAAVLHFITVNTLKSFV